MRNRDFSAKSMISLAQAIPGEAWLTELNQVDHSFSIRGASSDAAIVSDFMMRLQKTIYFKDVQLRSSTSDQSKKQISFELTARRD